MGQWGGGRQTEQPHACTQGRETMKRQSCQVPINQWQWKFAALRPPCVLADARVCGTLNRPRPRTYGKCGLIGFPRHVCCSLPLATTYGARQLVDSAGVGCAVYLSRCVGWHPVVADFNRHPSKWAAAVDLLSVCVCIRGCLLQRLRRPGNWPCVVSRLCVLLGSGCPVPVRVSGRGR